jgi:o-succinylbenzoate synthase
MRLSGLELIRVGMPLVSPFRTSFGVETSRDVLLVRAVLATGGEDAGQGGSAAESASAAGAGGEIEGWAECSAPDDPYYGPDYVAGSAEIIRRYLAPMLFAAGQLGPASVGPAIARVRGHRMAKAAVETAILDAWLRWHRMSLAAYLGAYRTRVPCGVSVGIMDTIPALLGAVGGYLDQGYARVKLKIEPGWDVEPVRAVRERFGDIPLQVDANAAYTLADAGQLSRLDAFGLLLLEQPLAEDDLLGHAELARRVRTPICLDESIGSAAAAMAALRLGACSVVNVKPGRVGGFEEARRVHDVCRAAGVPVWCGGMLETGIGRAANLAFAALPGCTLPGDTSASSRYYETDITEPFVLADGEIGVPQGPGIGMDPLPGVLDRLAASRTWLTAGPAPDPGPGEPAPGGPGSATFTN